MRLIVVRHGKAEATSPSGRDEDRPLAARGLRHATYLASRAPSWGAVDAVVSSDATRAWATASAIAAALGVAARQDARLRVDHPVGPVLELIAECAGRGLRGVVLAGHNPQLSVLVRVLTSGGEAALKTGTAVVMDVATAGTVSADGLAGACGVVCVERGEA